MKKSQLIPIVLFSAFSFVLSSTASAGLFDFGSKKKTTETSHTAVTKDKNGKTRIEKKAERKEERKEKRESRKLDR